MIHIYRPTRYPDRDFIIFQATDDTLTEFKRRFPVSVRKSKKGFEGGYFTWLRDDYREHFFDFIKAYFHQHYVPPELRLSAFRTANPLSSLWPVSIWQQKVTDAIKAAFSEQGYKIVEDKEAGITEVIPAKASFTKDRVEIYRSVAFYVQIPEDRFPLLFCQEQFKLFMDGKPVSLGQIAHEYGEGAPVLQAVRHFTTRSTEDQFKLLTSFVRRIPSLAACEGIAFDPQPLTSENLGFDTWFWLHDSDAYLETASGLHTTLAQALLEEGGGFFLQPNDIQVVLLVPDPATSPVVPSADWERLFQVAGDSISQTLPDVEVPTSTLRYRLDDDATDLLRSMEAIIRAYPDRRVLTLMATPGADARYSKDPNLQKAENRSFKLRNSVKDMCRGGYIATIDWNRLLNTKELPYLLHTILVGGLYSLNAQPWKLANLPFEAAPAEASCFLGLAGRPDIPALAGLLFDHRGTLVAYGATTIEKDDAPFVLGQEIESLIRSLLEKGSTSAARPKHVIVHITPDTVFCGDDIQATMKSQPITCDLVSIHSGAGMRFWQPDNQQGTPSHGIAVGSEKQKVAYLMNTLSVAEKTNNKGYVHPGPTPVMIRQLAGPTSIKTLAAHIYWLSVAHISSLHRTVDVPITIAYTQSLFGHVCKTRRSMPVRRNQTKTLFWL